jgi:hypothetical protein
MKKAAVLIALLALALTSPTSESQPTAPAAPDPAKLTKDLADLVEQLKAIETKAAEDPPLKLGSWVCPVFWLRPNVYTDRLWGRIVEVRDNGTYLVRFLDSSFFVAETVHGYRRPLEATPAIQSHLFFKSELYVWK